MKKMWYRYTVEYYSDLRNEMLQCAAIMLSEINQTKKDKYCYHMWNLETKTNEYTEYITKEK